MQPNTPVTPPNESPKKLPTLEGTLQEPRVFVTRCAKCDCIAATIEIRSGNGTERLIYNGIVAGTGPGGTPISSGRTRAIASAFTPPYEAATIRAADFYDDAGFCASCGVFYCFTHWNPSTTGGGRCPHGHFKSLDPHWSPDD